MADTGSPADFWAGFVAFVAIVVALAVLMGRAERARHARNKAFALAQGWTFIPNDPSLVMMFRSHPFGIGHSRSATDAMRGSFKGRDFVAFGYHYVVGSGKNRTSYDYGVLAVRVPGRIPLVSIGPEHIGTRVMAAFGADDVEVESEEFNRRWFVAAENKRAAHALLTPRMIERFLQEDLNWKTVGFEPGLLMTCTRGKLDLPKTMPPFDTLCDIADLVPDFLAQDFPTN
jgi:hypothetical protein